MSNANKTSPSASDASLIRQRAVQPRLASLGSFAGSPRGMQQHRRSSIPYAGRQPKVTFIRGVELHSVAEAGPCSPLYAGTPEEEKCRKRAKSILKINKHPILVDLNLVKDSETELEEGITNDQIISCKSLVDTESQRIYQASRQARGSVDILSFPVAYSVVEPFSRILGTILISIQAIYTLHTRTDFEEIRGTSQIVDIERSMNEFLIHVKICEETAKKFEAKAGDVFKQWSKLMKMKQEFQIKHSRINVPIYPNKVMPENVTLYEDVRGEEERYFNSGEVTLALNKDVLNVCSEFADGTCFKERLTNMTLEQQCEIIFTVINHLKELVIHATKHISNSTTILTESECTAGYENVKKRILDLKFDSLYDPLCGLDLKNSLGELVERKCELLNLASKIYTNVTKMRKLVLNLNFFTQRIVRGKRDPPLGTCLAHCPCGPKYLNRHDIVAPYKYVTKIIIQVPMSSHFQNIVFEDILNAHGDEEKMESVCYIESKNTESLSIIPQFSRED